MVHSWLVERMAEEHRRDLRSLGDSRHQPTTTRSTSADLHVLAFGKKPAPPVVAPHDGPPALRLSVQPERRPVGHQVGTLLIRLGTRLGGASMRTS